MLGLAGGLRLLAIASGIGSAPVADGRCVWPTYSAMTFGHGSVAMALGHALGLCVLRNGLGLWLGTVDSRHGPWPLATGSFHSLWLRFRLGSGQYFSPMARSVGRGLAPWPTPRDCRGRRLLPSPTAQAYQVRGRSVLEFSKYEARTAPRSMIMLVRSASLQACGFGSGSLRCDAALPRLP